MNHQLQNLNMLNVVTLNSWMKLGSASRKHHLSLQTLMQHANLYVQTYIDVHDFFYFNVIYIYRIRDFHEINKHIRKLYSDIAIKIDVRRNVYSSLRIIDFVQPWAVEPLCTWTSTYSWTAVQICPYRIWRIPPSLRDHPYITWYCMRIESENWQKLEFRQLAQYPIECCRRH